MIHDFVMMPGKQGAARAALGQASAYLRVSQGETMGNETERLVGSFGGVDVDPHTLGQRLAHSHDTHVGSFADTDQGARGPVRRRQV